MKAVNTKQDWNADNTEQDRDRCCAQQDRNGLKMEQGGNGLKIEQDGSGLKIEQDGSRLKMEQDGNGCLEDDCGMMMEKEQRTSDRMLELERQVQSLLDQTAELEANNRRMLGLISEALSCISTIQSGKTYRMMLMAQRFVIQCLKTNDRRDFINWFSHRMLRKDTTAKALREFDSLEAVRIGLGRAAHRRKSEKIKKMILFASVPFYDVGGGQRSAQLARAFHSLGYRVYYIYGFPCAERGAANLFIPVDEHRRLDEISRDWLAGIMDSQTMAIFEIPYKKFEPYLDLAKKAGCYTVYEHIDNWDTSLGCLFYEAPVFERFLKKADLVTVTAEKLGEKIKEHSRRPYLYLPNAVNTEIFEPLKHYDRPSDLKRGAKTLLYFGSLWGEWFDWEKISYIARMCPDCSVNLIGDYSGCMERVRRKRKNVHFLGIKKQTDLPAYLKYTDYALLPFKGGEIGAYVSPLKIFEYIAMNVRVLAADLPDIQGYPNVFCSNSKEDWVRVIKSGRMPLKDSSVFLSENNWYARCAQLMDRSGMYHRQMPGLSVIILNYNNRNVIRRCVDTLLAHSTRYGYEIIVVDNGSTDGSYEFLAEAYQDQKILLLKNKKNGCSSGRNLGVSRACGEYLCFLDSDQWVVSDYWLDSGLDIFQTNSQIGAAGWAAGWFSKGRAAGPIADSMPNRAISSADIWYRTDIAYLGTGGLVMKKELFETIGGFDEAYDPTCFEDTDLSLQIRDAGYELAYCPYIGIMHLPHQTTKSGSRKHAKLMKRNEEYFVAKWKERRPELLEYYYV